jgi:hypothetical protein
MILQIKTFDNIYSTPWTGSTKYSRNHMKGSVFFFASLMTPVILLNEGQSLVYFTLHNTNDD